MKKKIFNLFLILIMVMVFSPIVHAEDKPDGAEWVVNEEDNHVWYKIEGTTLTIGGSGKMPDWNNLTGDDKNYKNAPWYNKGVTDIIIDEGIKKIGDYSFYDAKLIISIKIANSVEEIGIQSFRNCIELKSIEFNEGLKYIRTGNFDQTALTSLILPEGLIEIEKYNFQSNQKLAKIVFPSSLTSIGDNSFLMNPGNVLKEIVSYNKTAPILGNDNVFKNVDINKITIPSESLESYKNWSIYKDNTTVNYLYNVIFNLNGGTGIDNKLVEPNNKLVKPIEPTKDGYIFDGWYIDEQLNKQFDFNKPITKDITLYAKWREVESFTYKFINGENQELTIGNIKSFVLKIDGDHSLFESLKIGELDLIKDEDYVVTEGSTIITFTDKGIAKLNTLSKGEYEIVVKYLNGEEAKGKLILNQLNTSEIEGNPKTGDNIVSYLIIGSFSLISLACCSFYLNRKRFN